MESNKNSAELLLQTVRRRGFSIAMDEYENVNVFGGKFPDELRKRASELKSEIIDHLRRERDVRMVELSQAKRKWSDFATAERGFYIGEVVNGVTEILRREFEAVERGYIAGTTTLKSVHAAFNRYAKSCRRGYFNNQLSGSVFGVSEEAPSAERLHRLFEETAAGSERRDMRRMNIQTVTPQIELTEDSMERMGIYFGLTTDEYLTSRNY